MKKIIFTFYLLVVSVCLLAQVENPVQWSYAATKKSDKSYEVIITATLPHPWHIYSQATPKGGPVPTSFTFNKNPLVTANGTPKEVGNLKTIHDKTFGVDVKYFDGKVEFIETVTLKTAVKTNFSGTVEYMVCNDSECLPPVKKTFEVKLQ